MACASSGTGGSELKPFGIKVLFLFYVEVENKNFILTMFSKLVVCVLWKHGHNMCAQNDLLPQ